MMRYTSAMLAVCSSGSVGSGPPVVAVRKPVLRTALRVDRATLRGRRNAAAADGRERPALADAPVVVQQVREVVDVHPELERVAPAQRCSREVLGDAEVGAMHQREEHGAALRRTGRDAGSGSCRCSMNWFQACRLLGSRNVTPPAA